MKRAELEKAMRYFSDLCLVMQGGNFYSEPLPYMQAALSACCERLDALDKKDRERLKAVQFFKEEIERLNRAPEINGCEMTPEWKEDIRMCEIAIELLEDVKNE